MIVWKIEAKTASYVGGGDFNSHFVHKFHRDWSWELLNLFHDKLFTKREDAENFLRPYAEFIYNGFMNTTNSGWDLEADGEWVLEEDLERNQKHYDEWKERGFREVRIDEMTKEDYEVLFDDEVYEDRKPCTLWLIPWEYDCDRIGMRIGSIYPVEICESLTEDMLWVGNEKYSKEKPSSL